MNTKNVSSDTSKASRDIRTTIENGRELVVVPLGRKGEKGEAVIWKDDWDFLIRLGLSTSWNRLDTGYVHVPCRGATGSKVLVARVLLDAGEGQTVRYRDGDKLNLRNENLELVEGFATRRDRDFLKRNKWRIEVRV